MPVPTATKIKNLAPAEAQKWFLIRFKPTYSVSAKFTDDHVVAAPNLSKSTSIAAAVARYQKQPNILVSSWILVDANTLKNKAASAPKVACVYQGAQQMALAIKVERRTVTITARTRKQMQGDNPDRYLKVTLGDGDRFLDCKSDMDYVTLCVKGSWNPLKGLIDIYHYEEGSLPSIALLPKYLQWVCDASGNVLGPVAKV